MTTYVHFVQWYIPGVLTRSLQAGERNQGRIYRKQTLSWAMQLKSL